MNVGDLYLTCMYVPARCTETNWYEDIGFDTKGISLLDDQPVSCSPSCIVTGIDQETADKFVAAWKSGGERAAMILAGWSEKDVDAFLKEWR